MTDAEIRDYWMENVSFDPDHADWPEVLAFARAIIAAQTELESIAKVIVAHYAHKPDDYQTSIGDWELTNEFGVPEFRAYIGLPLRDWRKYAKKPSKASIPAKNEWLAEMFGPGDAPKTQ